MNRIRFPGSTENTWTTKSNLGVRERTISRLHDSTAVALEPHDSEMRSRNRKLVVNRGRSISEWENNATDTLNKKAQCFE